MQVMEKDWQICHIKEKNMLNNKKLSKLLGLEKDEWIPYGDYVAKIDHEKIKKRFINKKRAKFIIVTAITPTKFGEGKTTSTIGLIQGLGKLNKKVTGALRQPSGGPTFNIKGSASGGGLSQCIPMTSLALGLTGDIDSITNAHNLIMVALTSRMQHENNYDDEKLKLVNLKRLDIDKNKICWKWAIDFCAQALRNIEIGIGGKMDGVQMSSGFQISVSSEIMAILSISRDLNDFKERIGKIIVAYNKNDEPITTKDLKVDGAVCALLINSLKPNLLQSIEGQPIFIHAGPFANIAIGQSSIIADDIGLLLSDYHVTECGFGSDIGYEKFWNIKCRVSNNYPDAVVIVTTIRSLKMHGSDLGCKETGILLLKTGLYNLFKHIEIVKKSKITPIVCINRFIADSEKELTFVKEEIEKTKIKAIISNHWQEGGKGSIELAKAVIDQCENNEKLKLLYNNDISLEKQIETIACQIYGATSVIYSKEAKKKLMRAEEYNRDKSLIPCISKTQYSLGFDPKIKNPTEPFNLPINDVLIFAGAGLVVPVVGEIKLLPGTGSRPAFMNISVNDEGNVEGLF